MKKLTILSSALLLAGGWQLAQAQPPGGGPGGGGRGGGMGMTFDGLNTDKTAMKVGEEEVQVITQEEFTAFFANLGGRGGGGPGGPGGGAPGGAGPQGGGGAPGGGGGGRGGFDPAAMFGQWDANGDGYVTQAEFDARPQGRGGAGRGGPGGGGGRGAPPAQ